MIHFDRKWRGKEKRGALCIQKMNLVIYKIDDAADLETSVHYNKKDTTMKECVA